MSAPPASWPPERLDALNRLTLAARLLSTAVHETGNSLQIISGNAELLEAHAGDSDKARARAQTIKTHADRASARLRALVALASGPEEAARPVDLGQAAERAVDLRRYSLARAGVAVSIEAPRPVRALAAEPALIRILANLILNAEAAMASQPSRAISLRLEATGDLATITVTDSGPGLTADAAARVFEPFTGPGGCGLAVSRWLAERQGGRLTVEATSAGGAAFRLALPAA